MISVIGIDFGTTNSVCAFIDGDEPKIVPNDRGNRLTPSVVAFTDNGVLVGEAAKNQAVINPLRTVASVKRLLGTDRLFNIGNRLHSPEEICAYILQKLKKDAEQYLGTEINEAVITAPAYFTEKQRRALSDSGNLASLKIKRILNEPTAAALAGSVNISGDRRILVYDFGGGTFDVTYLIKQGNDFLVMASGGDNSLGGDDFDALLLKEVLCEFSEKSGCNLSDDPSVVQQLKEQVEKAKIELSSRESAYVSLPFYSASGKAVHLKREISRDYFNSLILPYINKTMDIVNSTLRDAGASKEEVESLIFSGGSSRIPLVQTLLFNTLGLRGEHRINPDEAVASGAALQSLLLENNHKWSLKDITPFTLGVEIEGGQFIGIISRNTPIPVKRRRTFTTISDNQQSVEIHLLQGESPKAADNVSLGRFLLSGIRQGSRGEPHIEVLFNVDENGILHVSAKDMDTGVFQKVSIIGDNSGMEMKEGVKVEEKLKTLIKKLRAYVGSNSYPDELFIKEMEDIIIKSEESIRKKDKGRLFECLTALETIYVELIEYNTQERVDYEGA